MMTYKEFKNALTTELNTKLGTGGNAQPGTDTIMGCLMETVTVTIISTGQKYSANTDKLYELYRNVCLRTWLPMPESTPSAL